MADQWSGVNVRKVVDERMAELVGMLVPAMRHIVAESALLSKYEVFMGSDFPDLLGANRDTVFQRLILLSLHLGGPSTESDHNPTGIGAPVDGYPDATIKEVIAVYERARMSVMRASFFMQGTDMLTINPHFVDKNLPVGAHPIYLSLAEQAFWEHAETAYIRLASFWDRVGQVMEFAFFNVRKFEHSTFSTVMKKIQGNVMQMLDDPKNDQLWNRLWKFHNANTDDGYTWLVERRNMMIHNLHLHPLQSNQEVVFSSQYNHLETRHAANMKPRPPAEEVKLLVNQLHQATALFDDFIAFTIDRSPSRRSHSSGSTAR
jgi:hypothetical protein